MTRSLPELPPPSGPGRFPLAGAGTEAALLLGGSAGPLASRSPVTVVGGGVPGADRGLWEQAQCVVMGDG